jgi:hypothetical protein
MEELLRMDIGDTQFVTEKARQLFFADIAQFDEAGADLASVKNPVVQGLLKLFMIDETGIQQHVQKGDGHRFLLLQKVCKFEL